MLKIIDLVKNTDPGVKEGIKKALIKSLKKAKKKKKVLSFISHLAP